MEKKKPENKKLTTLEVQNKAISLGVVVILVLTTIFYILEVTILNCHNYGWYSIIAIYCTLVYGYKAAKLPKKQYWLISFIWFATTIVCIINYITHRF